MLNRVKAKISILGKWLTAACCLWLIAQPAYSIPGTQLESSGAQYSTALYEEVVIDMQVKHMGGMLDIKRQWKDGRWIFNPAWRDLTFIYDGALGGDEEELLPESISRNGFIYKRQGSASQVYAFDKRKTIIRTDDGYRWADREGNWINYDADGKILAFGNRNNIKVSFTRNAEDRIHQIKDHFDTVLVTFSYGTGGISSVSDYSNRTVSYTYSGNDLTKVTDVMGYDWLYTYETLLGRRVLKSKTDPEGRVININHVVSGGGSVCVESEAGNWVYNEQTQSWEHRGGRCLRTAILPSTVILASISDAIGPIRQNRYFYDADEKTYTLTTVENGRRVNQVINLKGEIIGEEINGETQSTTVISTDRRRRVVTDENGFETKYEYDEYENQTKITYPDGSSESWTYDRFSNVLTYTDENGVITKNEYDANGNLIRKTEALGKPAERITEYAYDEYGNVLQMKQLADAVTEEAVTKWTYGNYGNIKTETDPEGHLAEFTYDVLGNVLTEKDPREHVWTKTYDKAGNLLMESTPLEHMTIYEYDKVGNRVKVTDALTNFMTYAYDARNHLIKEIDPYGQDKIYKYNQLNQLIEVIDEEKKSAKFEFDSYNRLIKLVDANGNIHQFEYGGGNASSYQISRIGYPTHSENYFYDKRQRLIAIHKNLSEQEYLRTEFQYDSVGNRIKVIDTAERSYINSYDELGRIISALDPSGNKVSLVYDNRDNLLSFINEKGIEFRRYQYTLTDKPSKEIWPDGETFVYSYDGSGNLKQVIDAKGQVAEFTYNSENHQIQADYYSGVGEAQPKKSVSFIYNAVGNLAGYDDGQTKATYNYDKLQRKLSESVNYGIFSLSHTYTYTANGKKASMTYPDNQVIQYGYDASKQLNLISIPGQGNITVNSYLWRMPEKVTLPGGSIEQYTYDSILRLSGIKADDPAKNTLMDFRYAYGTASNIVEKETEHGLYQYSYDALNRLLSAQNPELEDESFTYDVAGNRLTSAATIDDWQYNEANQLLSAGDSQYEYDLNGNMTSRKTNELAQVFIYNLENRLAEVRDEDNNLIATYMYDPFGRRLSKSVNGVTTYFHYAEEGLIAEYDASGNLIQSYGYTPDAIWGTDPIYTCVNGQYYYYLNDHLGVPQKLINLNGAVQWSMQQQVFGKATIDAQSSINSHLRFPGQYYDEETGLFYNYLRYYDPDTGRYIQPDPIGILGGHNSYDYVYSNPLTMFDPYGLWSWGDPLPQGLVDGAAGFGDTLSFGLTGGIRDLAGIESVNKCSSAYGAGQIAAMGMSVGFGGAHLGRNIINQSSGSFKRGLGRLFSDRRQWGSVQRTWSRSVGGYKGKYELHHWFTPRSRGGPNAGWNYFPVSGKLNNRMSDGGALYNTVKALTMGIYGAIPTATINNVSDDCGC